MADAHASRVTIGEVALRAGVSAATVSRVLNRTERNVAPELRERVELAVSELGYRPNVHARALASSKSNVIGLLVHDLVDPYYSTIVDAVVRRASSQGFVVLVSSTFRDLSEEVSALEALSAQGTDTVILIGTRTLKRRHEARVKEILGRLKAAGGRAVSVSEPSLGTHTVVPPNREGAFALAEALTATGHDRFLLLGGPKDLMTARDREAGFLAGLKRSGVPGGSIVQVTAGFGRDEAFVATAKLPRSHVRGRCVFAVNDQMALGALSALREKGLKVPGEAWVAGFGDIPTLRDVTPSLTTVSLPLTQMGELAFDLAGESDGAVQAVQVGWGLRLRESTRRP